MLTLYQPQKGRQQDLNEAAFNFPATLHVDQTASNLWCLQVTHWLFSLRAYVLLVSSLRAGIHVFDGTVL